MYDDPKKTHEPEKKEHEHDKPGQGGQQKPGQPPPGQQPGKPGQQPGQGGAAGGGGKLVEEAGSPPHEEKEGEGGGGGKEGGEEEEPAPLGKSSQSVEELNQKMLGGAKAIKQAVEGQADKLAEVITLKGSSYKFRGRCKQCGWQSFQMDEGAAQDMVKQHALTHWKDLLAQKQGQSAGLSPQHQPPQGEPLPGQQGVPGQQPSGQQSQQQSQSAST